jgi:carbonic anhydrase
MSRRRMGFCLAVAAALAVAKAQSPCPDVRPKNADEAWDFLATGNRDFAAGHRRGGEGVAGDRCRLNLTGSAQHPFAIVLACADSRIPVEMLFDQRIGDIFVVRVAGNVATDEAIGSIEYAIKHLTLPEVEPSSKAAADHPDRPSSAKILVVLGHEECGAVKAALDPSPSHDMIPSILNRIFPAIQGLRPQPKDASPPNLDRAIRANVDLTVKLLPAYSPVIAKFGARNIRGAYYSLESGRVTMQPAPVLP